MLLEDAEDLAGWFAGLGRTVASTWCDDVRSASLANWADGLL